MAEAPKRISIRKVDGLTIVFYDCRTIYVKHDNDYFWTIVHRWFHRKRFYCTKLWKPFTKKLRYNRHVSMQYVRTEAEKIDAEICGGGTPRLEGKEIIMLPSIGRIRAREHVKE